MFIVVVVVAVVVVDLLPVVTTPGVLVVSGDGVVTTLLLFSPTKKVITFPSYATSSMRFVRMYIFRVYGFPFGILNYQPTNHPTSQCLPQQEKTNIH